MKLSFKLIPILATGALTTGIFAAQNPELLNLGKLNRVLKSFVTGAMAIQDPEVAEVVSGMSLVINEQNSNVDTGRLDASATVKINKSIWSDAASSLKVDLDGVAKPETSEYESVFSITLKTDAYKALTFWVKKTIDDGTGWRECAESSKTPATEAVCAHLELAKDVTDLKTFYKWAGDQVDLELAARPDIGNAREDVEHMMRAFSNAFHLAALSPTGTFDLQIADMGKLWDISFGPFKIKITGKGLTASLRILTPITDENLNDMKELIKSELLKIQTATSEEKKFFVDSTSEYIKQVYGFIVKGDLP